MELDFIKGNKIGYTVGTPNLSYSPPQTKPVLVILMSCGGGMGGSSWKEAVEFVEEVHPNTLQQFTTIEGEKITLNTSFIVKVSNYDLVTVFYEKASKSYLIKSDVDWEIVNGRMECDTSFSETEWELEYGYKDAPIRFTKEMAVNDK